MPSSHRNLNLTKTTQLSKDIFIKKNDLIDNDSDLLKRIEENSNSKLCVSGKVFSYIFQNQTNINKV